MSLQREVGGARSVNRGGRPRTFDAEAALRSAMLLFWRNGYEGTSISDLEAATGLTAPSIYGSFGNKKQLFLKAVDAYVGDRAFVGRMIDAAPSAWMAASGLLEGSAMRFTGPDTPAGCLIATSTISCSDASADVRQALREIRQEVTEALKRRIQRDLASIGDRPDVDAGALAALTGAVIQGMSTLARDGVSRTDLLAAATLAMRAWPEELVIFPTRKDLHQAP